MKISDVTLQTIKDFCGVSDSDSNELLSAAHRAALSFLLGQTGLSAERADEYEDLTMALLVLVNELYTTRTFTVDSGRTNPFAAQIIGLHRENLV